MTKNWARFSFVLIVLSLTFDVFSNTKECPKSISAQDLIQWRKEVISEVLSSSDSSAMSSALKVINKCFPDEKPACYQDMYYYLDQAVNRSAYPRGTFDSKDLTLKSINDLPPEFINAQGNISIPDNIVELVEKNKANGWKMAYYKTRSTGGFDGSQNLFIVTISDGKRDIVLQTSPSDDHEQNDLDPNPKSPISGHRNVLTIITRDNTQRPPTGQLRRLRGSGNDYEWSNDTEVDSCVKCHTMPMRPISPVGYKQVNGSEIRMTPQQEANIDSINSVLSRPTSWGTNERNGRVTRLGPAINSQPYGWAPVDSDTRKEEFLKNCSSKETTHSLTGFSSQYRNTFAQSENPNINYAHVARSMNCLECHDGQRRGVLHESFSRAELKFKILVDRSMPPNAELSMDERIALYNCMIAEQEAVAEKWRDSGEWMSKASCFTPQFKTPPKSLPKKVNIRNKKTDSTNQ